MEPPINPYEAGKIHQETFVDRSSHIPVTPSTVNALLNTRFWVYLVGIVLLVIDCLYILSLLSLGLNMRGGLFLAIIIPVIFTMLQLFLAVRLIQYGVAIGRLKNFGTSEEFEQAIVSQSKFWKLLGVISLVIIVLMIASTLIEVFTL
jgi:hypothetical protein